MLGPKRGVEAGRKPPDRACDGEVETDAQIQSYAAAEAEGIDCRNHAFCVRYGRASASCRTCPIYEPPSARAPLVAEVMADTLITMSGTDRVPRPLHSRLVKGVTAHFMLRSKDWIMTSLLICTGITLIQHPDLFQKTRAFDLLAQYGPTSTWGIACVFIGVFRFMSLFINGTFPGFIWSPHFRTLGALMSGFIWFQITIAVVLQASQTPIMAVVVPHLLALDLLNAYLASSEAGIAERHRRHGPRTQI